MDDLVIASADRSAGKTSIALGVAQASGKKIGYIKPFGDRPLYKKKRLWDYDTALMTRVFSLEEKPDYVTMGFAHAKLKYMYSPAETKKRVKRMASVMGKGKDMLLVEGGSDLAHGASVNLDAISVANYLDAKMLLVASGDDYCIMDNLMFIKKYIDVENVNLAGVVINKVRDIEDFKETHLPVIERSGIEVFGLIPFRQELTHMSVSYLLEHVFAKVVAGEDGLSRMIKNIFVADMSATAALENPGFKQEDKLVVTSGDRTDTILAALEHDTSCVILSNNIMPPSNIISAAADKGIPLLLVPCDSYHTALQVERIEPLLTSEDREKIDLLSGLIKAHVKIDEIW